MLPQPDPAGVLMAVISAGLLTFALVYVVRSRRTVEQIDTPLSAAFSGDLHPMEPELFGNVFLDSGRPGLGLAASAALHLLVIVGTPLFPYLFPEKLKFDLRRFDMKLVEFRVPRPLLYAAPDRAAVRAAAPRIRMVESAAAGAARQQAAARKPPLLRYELPAGRRIRSQDVVIQPDQPPDLPLTPPLPLPRTFLWAQGPAPLQESVNIGANQPRLPAPFLMPEASPKVQTPNRELSIGELEIAAGPVLTFRAPQLPMPVANISPLSMPATESPRPGDLPATPLPPGSPINLVALMKEIAAAAPSYLMDTGNRAAEAGLSGAAVPGAESGASAAPAAGAAKATHAELLAAAPGSGASSGAAAADNRPKTPATDQTSLTGNLGVIVVQQNTAEAGMDGAEALTGEPVYTVYFDVPGSPRRWVLQYCVPHAAGATFVQETESRVRILPRKTIKPPFPLERLPVDLKGFQGAGAVRRLVIYAMVSARGEVENIRLVRGTGQEVDTNALATLRRWSFRPAIWGDAPVAVEALFGIPLD